MVSLVFYILQLPHTVISNSEKLTHPNEQAKTVSRNFSFREDIRETTRTHNFRIEYLRENEKAHMLIVHMGPS